MTDEAVKGALRIAARMKSDRELKEAATQLLYDKAKASEPDKTGMPYSFCHETLLFKACEHLSVDQMESMMEGLSIWFRHAKWWRELPQEERAAVVNKDWKYD